MVLLTPEEVVSGKTLGIEDILRYATPEIDVLAIDKDGRDYARRILQQLEGRGRLFAIDPHFSPLRTYPIPESPAEYCYSNDSDFMLWYHNLRHERPRNLPDINPRNTVVICDDFYESGRTFSQFRFHLEGELGYNFDSDKPPHFKAMQNMRDWDEIAHTNGCEGEYGERIMLVRYRFNP